MDAFAAAANALFADQNTARDAIWRAGGIGGGIAVRTVTRRPDQVVGFGENRAILPTMLIDVRRSEVAAAAAGDTVEIDGETFAVIATPLINSLGLIWTCEAALEP